MNKPDDKNGQGTYVSWELPGKDINSDSGIFIREGISPCSRMDFVEYKKVNNNNLFAKSAFSSQKYKSLRIKIASNSYRSLSKTGSPTFQIEHYSYHNPRI
jgi:hypothetical protein